MISYMCLRNHLNTCHINEDMFYDIFLNKGCFYIFYVQIYVTAMLKLHNKFKPIASTIWRVNTKKQVVIFGIKPKMTTCFLTLGLFFSRKGYLYSLMLRFIRLCRKSVF